MKMKINADENGMVKRLMKAGNDYVSEYISEELCQDMIDNATTIEPSGRSDYPTMVHTQEGIVFYLDAEVILTKKERGIHADAAKEVQD